MSDIASAMTYSGTDSFAACLAGSTTPKIVVSFTSRTATGTTALLQQCVAAVLNAALFGSDHTGNGGNDYYNHGSVASVTAYINSWLKAASRGKASPSGNVGAGNPGKANNATTCLNSLTSTLTTWNTQGGSSC
jgi:hypothetical protein